MNRVATLDTDYADNAPEPRALTQSIALEESPLPHLLSRAITLLGILMIMFLGWASFTNIDEVATAQGQVIPTGYVQSIQHLEGGIVKEIMVHDGDLVEPGQPLFRLDDTSAAADLGQMQARQQALQLQASRLRNFTGHKGDGDNKELTTDETAILSSMVVARDSQRNVLRAELSQKQKELQALQGTREALSKNIQLMEHENIIKQNLAAKGYGSQLMALESSRELNQMRGQLNETIAQENRAREAISEANSKLVSLNADLTQQAMKTLGDVEGELAEVDKTLDKYQGTASRTLITAPVRGIVKGLNVHTLGAVIEQGKVLMEIVPVNQELVIEANIEPSEIGHIKKDAPVNIKISAFDFARYGSVPGHVESLSATTFQNDKGESFYKARIKLDRNYAGHDSKANVILPGMTVTANIITGEKSVLRYLLKPIQIATEGAFHEH